MSWAKSRHVLRLREYEHAAIGDAWNPDARIISQRVAAEIERLQAGRRVQALTVGRRAVQAQQFVGTLGGEGWAIDILPKVDQEDGVARANLMQMLAVAGLVPTLDGGFAALGPNVPTLLDTFLLAYVEHLGREWRRGRIANYRRRADNRPALRGKLQFAEHLRQNLLRPERFHTSADEFLQDVPLSRLLKAGLRICQRHAVSDVVRRAAAELLPEFEWVTDSGFAGKDLERIQVDRQTARFGPVVKLAKLLVAGSVPDRPGQGLTYSFVFDMNVVFERYIGQMLRRTVCPPEHTADLQASGRSLLVREGRDRFRLRPDIAIREGKKLVCLIDTKWKQLDPHKPHEGVSQADMYQMYAYGKEYDCPLVILLYPRSNGMVPHVASYQHRSAEEDAPRIEVRTVDVCESARQGVPAVRRQLSEMLAAVLGGPALGAVGGGQTGRWGDRRDAGSFVV